MMDGEKLDQIYKAGFIDGQQSRLSVEEVLSVLNLYEEAGFGIEANGDWAIDIDKPDDKYNLIVGRGIPELKAKLQELKEKK